MEVPAFGDLFHSIILGFIPVENLPDPPEASKANLVIELIKS